VVESEEGESGVVSVEEVVRALVEPGPDNGVEFDRDTKKGPDKADPLDVLGQVLSAEG
jgi:hypothetical protein